MKPQLLLFDVNETLLDLSPMKDAFEELLGSAEPLGEWFARLLHGSLLANHLDSYRRFGEIGVDALVGVAAKREIELGRDAASATVALIRSLPAHLDVVPGLHRLSASGYRLAALTNGDPEAVADQLRAAEIGHLFEAALSVETTERFKPDPAPYLMACSTLSLNPEQIMMVAAHDWDVAGAKRLGMQTAFVGRPGARWGLPGSPPGLVVGDLMDLADQLEMEH